MTLASAAVRARLVRDLRLDLVGPGPEDGDALAREVLPETPSRWYLTGYLVPLGAPERQAAPDPQEELDLAGGSGAGDDDATPERGPARRSWLPSSMGLSLLVEEETASLAATVRWGDYLREGPAAVQEGERGEVPAPSAPAEEGRPVAGTEDRWLRAPREAAVAVPLDKVRRTIPLPGSGSLELACHVRPTRIVVIGGTRPVRVVSLFVVNRRVPIEVPGREDEASAFQVELEVGSGEAPFVARCDLKGHDGDDPDCRIADLHYRDVAEWGVGHNVSVAPVVGADGTCRRVRTSWLPEVAVPRVQAGEVAGVELGMDALGALPDAAAAASALGRLPELHEAWIAGQREGLEGLSARRREVAETLLDQAGRAARRVRDGITTLADPAVLDAFRTMNRAVAAAARRRRPGEEPRWRPFQIAFILLNLRGLVEPAHHDRETVDLLFFPTGGGKTEAYLGLAAFVLVLRRLQNRGGPGGCGLAVLMRYTLRLLTLDQLGRASGVVCALELERRADPARLGTWPFEIGLWVGRAATPNRMGAQGDGDTESARARVLRYKRDSSSFPPLPIESCPWCGARFDQHSFQLVPDASRPRNLELWCSDRGCPFSRAPGLPVLTVDEPIYRRLPGFVIATADKFAAMPWEGRVSSFFGRADRHDADGFYGPAEPGLGRALAAPLPPPDLVVQDELHLIAGPLGSMAGLYETALDALCARGEEDARIRPKIVASTATVRRAQAQIAALFDRGDTAVFPPPGPDRRDSFFAREADAPDEARLYLGLAAPGGSPKVLFLRAATTLMASAARAWEEAGGARAPGGNPADPYMTLVAYFNALRELGSARRIVEDEVRVRLDRYGARRRIAGEEPGPRFADRRPGDPLELTSRVGTEAVAEAKARLARSFAEGDPVDVALATNMISVGLDVVRLGLMMVSGQPKTAAEYIQATSRVGRDPDRPGLVVALLNLNKTRDRSHYERFAHWHRSFYRSVEAVSVTPFAPRALDRGLAAVTVALARLGHEPLTPGRAAREMDRERPAVAGLPDLVATRRAVPTERAPEVRRLVASLLDDWASLAHDHAEGGASFGYAGADAGVSKPLLREMLDRDLALAGHRERRFRAPRSLRAVEPSVLLRRLRPDGGELRENGR